MLGREEGEEEERIEEKMSFNCSIRISVLALDSRWAVRMARPEEKQQETALLPMLVGRTWIRKIGF